MTVWGVSIVKDEADVIGGTLRHLADEGLAGMIVADNMSTDGTRELLDKLELELAELDVELVVLDDDEPAHYQSRKVSALAELAREHGAEWVLPFDADELWLASDRIAVVLERLPRRYNVARARLFNHYETAIDPAGDDPYRTMQWRTAEPLGLPKIAFRPELGAVVHDGNHGVTLGYNVTAGDDLEIRHFPYRGVEHFIRKARNGAAALAAATDLPLDVGAHWRGYGELLERYGETVLEEVYREHFWYLAPFEAGLVHDPAPYLRWRASPS